jgi:four helix bundle protein
MKENIILTKSINFSVEIKKFTDLLISKRELTIGNQLQRCGMAIGANISEAQHAESRVDFIHKMKVAAKEANETLYWLSICDKMNNFGLPVSLLDEINQMIAIISKIIISARKNV